MRVTQLGDGTPAVAVVGGIHGDEPCGVRAIERLIAEDPAVERPVTLIVANEEALERGVRYVDDDLNRAFPGGADAEGHEGRLASALVNEIRDCTTLALHSTQSYTDPFALVDTVDEVARSICPQLPIGALVETAGFANGRLIEHAHTIEVECGLQGSEEATENAYWIVRSFLAATGALAPPGAENPLGVRGGTDVPVFRMRDRIPKPPAEAYEVFVSNFEEVEAGSRFARADDETLYADAPFVPVLLSAYGYADVFGYGAERVGTLP